MRDVAAGAPRMNCQRAATTPYGGRVKRVLAAVLVVAGLVAAFFAADDYARTRIVNGIEGPISVATGATPTVTLAGTLALPQVIRGKLDQVTVEIPSLPVQGGAVERVVIVASGVGTGSPYPAETVEATGLIPMATIEAAYQASTGFGGEADTAANLWSTAGEALGAGYALVFTPVVNGSSVTLQFTRVTLGGNDVDVTSLGWLLGDISDIEIVNLALPEGLTLDTVTLTDEGAELTLHGTNVGILDVG